MPAPVSTTMRCGVGDPPGDALDARSCGVVHVHRAQSPPRRPFPIHAGSQHPWGADVLRTRPVPSREVLRVHPTAPPTRTIEPEPLPRTVRVAPWHDPVVDRRGHDPRSVYVEQFWLGVLGPTATWLLRRLVAGFDHQPDGYELDVAASGAQPRAVGDARGRRRRSPRRSRAA